MNFRSFTIEDAAIAMAGELLSGKGDTWVTGISTDSRKVSSGDLYFALIGVKFDGHQFVPDVLNNSASGAVVSKIPCGNRPNQAIIRVVDTQLALGSLAGYYRSKFNIPIVAVTGSVGKTSVKDMVSQVLSQKYNVQKNAENFNNEIGVPLTLFGLRDSHQIAVIELAMRAKGQIADLARIVRPEVGIITNIGTSHIGILGSREAIAEAKSELILELKPGNTAILNTDDDFFLFLRTRAIRQGCSILSYGMNNPADITAEDVEYTSKGSVFMAATPTGFVRIELPVPGPHNVLNSLAAIAAGLVYDMDLNQISDGLSGVQSGSMRMEILHRKDGLIIISDCYNASPASMKAALETQSQMTECCRRIAVLGDMKELGGDSDWFHKEVGKTVADLKVDYLVTVGKESSWIAAGAVKSGLAGMRAVHFPTNREAVEFLKNLVAQGDCVLVKGSRAMKMEEIVIELLG